MANRKRSVWLVAASALIVLLCGGAANGQTHIRGAVGPFQGMCFDAESTRFPLMGVASGSTAERGRDGTRSEALRLPSMPGASSTLRIRQPATSGAGTAPQCRGPKSADRGRRSL